MVKNISFLLTFVFILSHGTVSAQEKTIGEPMSLFQSDEILELSLQSDFKTVFSVKDDSTLFPAKLSLKDNNGAERIVDVEIRTRGKTRRESDVCRFPPLRIEFSKKTVKNTPFEDQKALKLVTHCDKADFYEQNTILEYLIYKAYNVLTDSSFYARPARIKYIGLGGKNDTVYKFAFFIEREKNLAYRLGGIENETKKMDPTRFNEFQSCVMDMFQYMIGNTDYSVYDLHNVIAIEDSAGRFPPVPVPYDFDWSGLISANYAVMNPVVGTGHVSERVYRGFKKEPFIVHHTIEIFKARKQAIYDVFLKDELLEEDEKEDVVKYLDKFYEIINDERKIQTEFFDKARVKHE
jgi:hypothetical protein